MAKQKNETRMLRSDLFQMRGWSFHTLMTIYYKGQKKIESFRLTINFNRWDIAALDSFEAAKV